MVCFIIEYLILWHEQLCQPHRKTFFSSYTVCQRIIFVCSYRFDGEQENENESAHSEKILIIKRRKLRCALMKILQHIYYSNVIKLTKKTCLRIAEIALTCLLARFLFRILYGTVASLLQTSNATNFIIVHNMSNELANCLIRNSTTIVQVSK